MIMRFDFGIVLVSLMILLGACNTEPVFPLEPKIEFLDIQPKVVRSLQDSILITFRFQDGDGNIGILDDADPANLFLVDSRLQTGDLDSIQATNVIRLPDLSSNNKKPEIQGEMTVALDFTVLTSFFVDSQEVRYQIKLYDREGNLAQPISGSDGAVYTDYITVVR